MGQRHALPKQQQHTSRQYVSIGKHDTFLSDFIFLGIEEYNCDIFLGTGTEEYNLNRRT
jgi:hypothetical protein